jgi:hypothetical protein
VAETTYLGVIPYEPPCGGSPRREHVPIFMDGENDTHCNLDTGQGVWLHPAAAKAERPPVCPEINPPEPSDSVPLTGSLLELCRVQVNGEDFRPLTTDPNRTEDFYAILQFGERCPKNSVAISKKIINESTGNANSSPPNVSPNVVTGDQFGNFTWLFFCYFRNAPSEEETMSEFPDLGFHYAVFHDFDGKQPAWVIRKRWQLSDDSNNTGFQNSYHGDFDLAQMPEILDQFQRIIENPRVENPDGSMTTDTYFDVARVR